MRSTVDLRHYPEEGEVISLAMKVTNGGDHRALTHLTLRPRPKAPGFDDDRHQPCGHRFLCRQRRFGKSDQRRRADAVDGATLYRQQHLPTIAR